MTFSATPATRSARARDAVARRFLRLFLLALALLFALVVGQLSWQALRPLDRADLPETVGLQVVLLTVLQAGAALLLALPLALATAQYLAERSEKPLHRGITALLQCAASVPALAYATIAIAFVFGTSGLETCCVFFDPVPAAALVLALTGLPQLIVLFAQAFSSVPTDSIEACRALGLSRWRTFRTTVLPLAWRPLVTAIYLALVRTVGATVPVAFLGALWLGDGNRTLALELLGELLRGSGAAKHALWVVCLTSSSTLLAWLARARWERDP